MEMDKSPKRDKPLNLNNSIQVIYPLASSIDTITGDTDLSLNSLYFETQNLIFICAKLPFLLDEGVAFSIPSLVLH